jgi:SAM-dependent methyltransferase
MNLSLTSPPIVPATALNEWLFEIIQPYLKGRVLEIGSNFNTISTVFVQKGRRLHLSTADNLLREELRAHYQGVEAMRAVHLIDFRRPDFDSAYPPEEAGIFDTIVFLNPMQDAYLDDKAVRNARYLLKDKGRLILLTPAFTGVYSGFELDVNELKHLDRPVIKKTLTDEMEILITRHFHLLDDSGYGRSGPSVIMVARKK